MKHGSGLRLHGAVAAACLLATAAIAPMAAHAASSTAGPSSSVPLTTGTVALNFSLAIDKFIFFRIGDGLWPTPGGTTSSVSFTVAPTIPGGPTTPTAGHTTPVNWSGAAPPLGVTPSGNIQPVEVRSNAGQIGLHATVTTPLTNGAHTIPMSEITITSSDGNLPAPVIPVTGSGATVNVASTDATGLVTLRTANWTFLYANLASRTAGTYLGVVTFTASSP